MLATVASATSANRIKRYAANLGVRAHLIQTPTELTREGCGYSVRFDDSDQALIKTAAQELNITVRGYFYETEENGIKQYRKELS